MAHQVTDIALMNPEPLTLFVLGIFIFIMKQFL